MLPLAKAPRRLLIAEDEYLLATTMVKEFAKLGMETIGLAGTVQRAMDLLEHGGPFDGAVLDINLRGEMIFPVADALRSRGVPFVFMTGYSHLAIPDGYKDVAHFVKPCDPAELARALFSEASTRS
jgi:CheY-like chemotaxis protein